MSQLGLTQSELARRVGVTQGAIAKIANKNPAGSSYLHRVARELGTTPAYIAGEVDDPSADAPPPPPPATAQFVTLPVALPTEDTLYRTCLAVLMASRDLDEDALAHELARRLPTMLGVLRGPLTIEQVPDAPAEAPPSADRAPRRA